jgi:hypothetical protein
LWALGLRATPFFPDNESTWTVWYIRAAVRAQGLRSGTLDADGLDVTRSAMVGMIVEQLQYHRYTIYNTRHVDHRLCLMGIAAFIGALVVAAGYSAWLGITGVFGFAFGIEDPKLIRRVAIFLAATLPALALTVQGMRTILDFEGTVAKSERTCRELAKLIDAMNSEQPRLSVLRIRARTAVDMMISDVPELGGAAERYGLILGA